MPQTVVMTSRARDEQGPWVVNSTTNSKMSEDTEDLIQRPLPIFLQLLARIMTGLYFIEVCTAVLRQTRYLVLTSL